MADNGNRGGRGSSRGRFRGRWNNRWRGNSRGRGSSNRGGAGSSTDRNQGGGQSRQNRITEAFSPVPCPYKKWKYYFPTEDFTPTSRIVQHIKWATSYLCRLLDEDLIDYAILLESESFSLDYQLLMEDQELKASWPQLGGDLYSNPANTLAAFSLAMHQLLLDDQAQQQEGEDKSTLPVLVPCLRARLTNYKVLTPLKNLRAGLYGKLVAVSGTVVRVSNSRPLCISLAFKCRTCSGLVMHPQTDGQYELPARCYLEREDDFGGSGLQCTGNQFEPLRDSVKNVIVDWQTIRIQESSSDNQEVGRIPRSVDCELMEDLVGSCSPGEIVTLTGIVKVVSVTDSDRKSKEKNMFTHYIEAVSIQNQDRGSRADSDAVKALEADNTGASSAEMSSSSNSSRKGFLSFNLKDLNAVNKIHEEPNLFAFLVASLCPSIYGHELVKAGLLLSLFSGTKMSGLGSSGQLFTKRCDIHVLVVGDPGLGKSQMLQACSRVAPRGVYVCGNSTTSSGLTVTLTKDGQSGNEFTLEAGALVLADQGTCCIDEFDKMGNQHQALLEAMEQQSISLAKAGVVCSLPARASILAAANPVGGHYDRSKTVSENIKLGPALLSRFDLVFLLLDRPDSAVDTMLTEHILALHANSKSKAGQSSTLSSQRKSSSQAPEEKSFKSRLRLENEAEVDLLPAPLLRKYIAYAKEYVNPVLDDEARKEVEDFYLQLRRSQYAKDSTPVTPRQLESLVRLAQARAKAELREVANRQDALDVIELVKTSFDDVFKDEFGALDFTRSFNGSGMSSRNEGKKFVEALQVQARAAGRNTFSLEELKAFAARLQVAQNKSFSSFIDNLNHHGLLIHIGNKRYKLAVDC